MGRPIAYEYKGFLFNGASYPVWSDDTDKEQFYVMPPSLQVASDATGPKVTVSVCERLRVPAIDGLANLVPYISNELLEALKAEYGPRIAPLPVASGGQVLITGTNWTGRGLAVNRPWDTDDLSYEGMTPEQVLKLKEAKRWYEQDGIQSPLTDILRNGEGFAFEVPKLIGSNIGAEVPISFVVLGADPVTRFKSLLDSPGGGVINGQLLYYYVGTTRPWKLLVEADISKVHQFIDQQLSVGYFWAKANINDTVEKLKQVDLIKITVWDENDQVTAKYKPEKIFDTILHAILDKAFNFHPEINPNRDSAQQSGQRFWWWGGSYSRKSSTVDVSEVINIKLEIRGKSEPIPVSSGIFLRVPKYGTCSSANHLHESRIVALRRVYSARTPAELTALTGPPVDQKEDA